MSKQLVTLYTVRFSGKFGKNRTPKRHFSNDQAPGDENAEVKFLADLVRAEAAKIAPKLGKFEVVRYPDCEVNKYGIGAEAYTTYTIPDPRW